MEFPIRSELNELTASEIGELMESLDTCPLKNSGTRVVHPVGDGSSKIMLIGEAPGAKEDEQGEPFVGAAGKILNQELLPSVGLSRKNIYLTNIVKCRPPGNRDPLPEEKEAWSVVLLAEIISLKPNLIVCLGRHSFNFFFPTGRISQAHGRVLDLQLTVKKTQKILPLYHPAAALYNPSMKSILKQDFLVIKDYIDFEPTTITEEMKMTGLNASPQKEEKPQREEESNGALF
jgi:uracil-DNA glycosylase